MLGGCHGLNVKPPLLVQMLEHLLMVRSGRAVESLGGRGRAGGRKSQGLGKPQASPHWQFSLLCMDENVTSQLPAPMATPYCLESCLPHLEDSVPLNCSSK